MTTYVERAYNDFNGVRFFVIEDGIIAEDINVSGLSFTYPNNLGSVTLRDGSKLPSAERIYKVELLALNEDGDTMRMALRNVEFNDIEKDSCFFKFSSFLPWHKTSRDN